MSRHVFKNPHQEKKIINQRVIIAIIFSLCLIFFLFMRLAYVQLFKHHYYRELATENRVEFVPIPPSRGLIYDRKGVLLARNLPVFSLEITPSAVKNLKNTVQELSKILSIPEKEQKLFYKLVQQQARYQSAPLVLKLTEEQIALFSVNRYRFPGVEIKTHMLRDYPFSDEFSHVLGYVGRMNAKERANLDAHEYASNDYIGKTNLEAYYEKILHGKAGVKEIEIDASGNITRTLKIIPPIAGDTLHLSIDEHLQSVAIHAFDQYHGAMIALDPNNGEILAMVSTPSFDPNIFVQGILQSDYTSLINNPSHPLYNRALNGLYPPGSTVKPFIAFSALEKNIVNANEKIYDPGYFELKNSKHIFHDWNRKGNGWVDMHRAIVVSCDTYFYWLSLKMGIQNITESLNHFGLGQITGIDLPQEPNGLIPSPEWKQAHLGQNWYPGDTLNTAIGQGFTQVSPLQLALATATLAMHGQGYSPHLLAYRDNPRSNQPIFTQSHPLYHEKTEDNAENEQAFNSIIKAMQDVILSPEGRGFRFGRDVKYTVAAKTGTAQVYSMKDNEKASATEKLKDHGLFIAFAPIDKPKIVVVVVSEHTGMIAPIVARKVMDAYLL